MANIKLEFYTMLKKPLALLLEVKKANLKFTFMKKMGKYYISGKVPYQIFHLKLQILILIPLVNNISFKKTVIKYIFKTI